MPEQRRVVVGVDGSDSNRDAVRRAALEASAHGARLEVVHAWNFLNQPGPEFDPRYGEQAARERIERFIDEVLGPDRPDAMDVRSVNDLPAPALVAASHGAFTLVVGARGLGGFKGHPARLSEPAHRASRLLPSPRRALTARSCSDRSVIDTRVSPRPPTRPHRFGGSRLDDDARVHSSRLGRATLA